MTNVDILPITKNNHVDFFYDGDAYYEKFLAIIRNAKKSVHLQTYIFEMDIFGSRVHAELIHAAKRGVAVYLLIDSVGSRLFNKIAEEHLVEAGVHFCRFNGIQVRWLYRWGRRLHHKLLLVDQEEAIIGGINILSKRDPISAYPQLDFAVALRGPVTMELSTYCQTVLKRSSHEKIYIERTRKFHRFDSGLDVGISINDWSLGRSKITNQYTRITKEANKQITIINSYFFPRKKFMKQLVEAAKRGVKVRLILPKDSDWPSYILASEYLYDYFLKRGVEIYQWKKSVLHGKLATVDDTWSTIGSFNLNYTSYQQNLEMNVDVYSQDFTRFLNQEIETIIATGCEKLDAKKFCEDAPMKIRATRFALYLVMALIANFSIGLSFQEDYIPENHYINILKIVGSIIFLLLGIAGLILPIIPGVPFLVISFLLVYRQILLNKKKV